MAQVIQFTIRVDDEGTAVVEKFTKGVDDSANKAKKSAGKMTKAFAGVRKGLGGVSRAVFSLRGLLVGLGAAAVIRSVTRAAFAQEEAVARVNASLRASGQFSEEASQALQEFASQMQATTIFGDEVILNQIALAQAFGFTTENVREAVEAAVELSAAAGIELTEAIRRVGRTISGSTADVQKFAPEIANLTKEQLAAGDAAKVLGDALRGSAAAQAETARGRMIQLSNALGDVSEKLGQSITSSDKFLNAIKGLTQGINDANNSISGSGQLGDALAELIPSTETTTAALQTLVEIVQTMALGFSLLSLESKVLQIQVRAIPPAIDLAVSSLLGLDERVEAAQGQLKKLGNEIVDNVERIDRQFTALGQLSLAHEDARRAAKGQAAAQRDLGAATIEASRQTREAAESNRLIVDILTDLNKITPETAASVFKTFQELAERVAELPDSFAATRDELFGIMEALPGITKEQNDRIAAELDRLEQRFAQVPTAIQTPLQQSSAALTTFFATARSETGQLFAQQVSESQAALESITTTQAQLTEVFRAAEFQRSQIRGEGEEAERQRAEADIRINAAKNQVLLQGAFALGGALLSFADQGGRRVFEFAKGLAIAEATVSGIQATQAALASPPGPPFTIPLAAAIAVQTAANIRRIAGTQFMGGGGAGAAGGAAVSGGAVAAPAPGAPAPAVEAAPVAAGPQITISVSGFIGDEATLASALGEIISEAEGDDVEFQLS